MARQNVKVSILIPCYNAERWVAEAVRSALAQTYAPKEVVVYDDGSTDNSLEVIKGFGDRVRWESGPNEGGNAARNRLLALASGEWVQYLDADDFLLPSKVERQVEFLGRHPEADIVYSPFLYQFHDADGGTRRQYGPVPATHDPWVQLARWYLPQTGAPLWRRQAVLDVGGWADGQPCCQEHELYLRLLTAGKRFVYFEDAGSVYRQWSETTTCKRDKRETYRRRLEIKERMEKSLEGKGELTAERREALNQARFECARGVQSFDKSWAAQIVRRVRLSDPSFVPRGSAAPFAYRVVYRAFGFAVTEGVARWRRLLRSGVNSFINSPAHAARPHGRGAGRGAGAN